ncbi:MAG: VWA domain-containing protein [Pseudomonadota bacterium]
MRTVLSSMAALCLSCLPALAQVDETPSAILVLDGSGSMWGQIDGVNKIVIAREVIDDLLDEIPETQALGLTVYGHRTRGDCSDIETLIEPGTGNRDAIRAAVNGINPRGRTPMTSSVVAAARAMRHTENPATVILVSDGIETCEADPCAIATELEQIGIGFTAHVIGFDVADPEARAQMQCIATNTGGQFLTADNADELLNALTQVAAAPPPEPEPEPVLAPITFQAVLDTDDGPLINGQISWSITGGDVAEVGLANPYQQALGPGSYNVTATWVETGLTAELQIALARPDPRTVTVVFEAPLPTATLIAPDTAVAGSTIEVAWDGPGGNADFVHTTEPGQAVSATYALTRTGNPVALRVPSQPGTYDLHYVMAEGGRTVLTTRTLEVSPATATLDAPDMGFAGETVEVQWTGPAYNPDFIAVTEPGQATPINMTLTRNGNPAVLPLPPTPGQYELRYVMQTDREVLAVRPIEVVAISATLEAPETAIAGETIEVAWTGPDYQNDMIAVALPDDEGRTFVNRTFVRGEPVIELQMPTDAGTYELRYVMAQDRQIIGRRMIEVLPVTAALVAPDSAPVGSTVEIAWEGPDYRNDFVSVASPDDPRGYVNRTYARDGSPLELEMPPTPGTYELRYVMAQDREVIATRPIEVTPLDVSLILPDTAVAGSDIEVAWTGPDYTSDFISVAEPDDDRGYVNLSYTRDGSPLRLQMPAEPGTYEVRYVLSQDRQILLRRPIEVTAVAATLIAPETAVAGATVEVAWDGPDYANDFISVANPDDARGYVNYQYTRDGTPVKLLMPTEPGTYQLRYVLNQDREIIATRPIEITDVTASLQAPETANAGATVEVTWTGPDYANDFISVAKLDDARGYESYTYTREGTPLGLRLPTEPGTYELRYVINQDRQIIATRPIEVTAVAASMEFPATAPAGSTVEVAWTGPDYARDFIAVAETDDQRGYINYTYTSEGPALKLQMPPTPGTYDVRYIVGSDRTIIGTKTIEITPVVATIEAPVEAPAGSMIEVAWTGPDYARDFIAVGEPGQRYEHYRYTQKGSPARLQLPIQPGSYELRYTMAQDGTVLLTYPIEVTPVSASLVAPGTAVAGSTIEVAWTGPDYERDFIAIVDVARNRTGAIARTDMGPAVLLDVPSAPGEYVIRYFAAQGNTVLASEPLVVTAE